MRIMLVTPYFYPEGGGLERYAYNIFKRIASRGHEVTVFCATKVGEDSTEEIDGLVVNRLRPDMIVSNTPVRINLLSILSRELKEEKFDIVNAHTPVPYFAEVASLAALRYKIDYCVTYHSQIVSTRTLINLVSHILNMSIDRYMLNRAKRIITVNNTSNYRYLRAYIDKVVVIPPGVDTNRYKPSKYNPVEKRLLFIGTLSRAYEYKGLRVVIDAMPLIIRHHPDATLTVIGDGPLREEYVERCRRNGIYNNVIFRGRVSEEELISEYQQSTLLLVPTLTDTEGFGMVSLEANACGVPVVASRVGGIPYYVKDGVNGFLVDPGDSHMLANKVVELLSDQALLSNLSPLCRKRALEFEWEKITDMTISILEGVIYRWSSSAD